MAGLTRVPFLLVVLVVASACDTQDPFAIPTQPFTPVSATETFSGTLTRNAAVTFPFGTAGQGLITATLSAVGGDSGNPNSTVLLSLALGTWNGANCQIVLANDRAVQGTTVVGQAATAGSFCARVADVGGLVGSAAYEIQVVRP